MRLDQPPGHVDEHALLDSAARFVLPRHTHADIQTLQDRSTVGERDFQRALRARDERAQAARVALQDDLDEARDARDAHQQRAQLLEAQVAQLQAALTAQVRRCAALCCALPCCALRRCGRAGRPGCLHSWSGLQVPIVMSYLTGGGRVTGNSTMVRSTDLSDKQCLA